MSLVPSYSRCPSNGVVLRFAGNTSTLAKGLTAVGVGIHSWHDNVPYLVDDHGTKAYYPLFEAKREGFVGAEHIPTELCAIPEPSGLRLGLRLSGGDRPVDVPLWAKGFDGVDQLRPNLPAAVGYGALVGCVQIDPTGECQNATLLGVSSNGEETPLNVDRRTVGAYVGIISKLLLADFRATVPNVV